MPSELPVWRPVTLKPLFFCCPQIDGTSYNFLKMNQFIQTSPKILSNFSKNKYLPQEVDRINDLLSVLRRAWTARR